MEKKGLREVCVPQHMSRCTSKSGLNKTRNFYYLQAVAVTWNAVHRPHRLRSRLHVVAPPGLVDPCPPQNPRWPHTHPLPPWERERLGGRWGVGGAADGGLRVSIFRGKLEVVPIISSLISLATTWSCDHILLQGRLGTIVYSGRTGI